MYRDLNQDDMEILREEISKDPVHGKDPLFNASIFLDPDGRSLVFEDNFGPVMYVNIRKEIRITIQFVDGIDKNRIREVFQYYIPIFSKAFKDAGFVSFNYSTDNKILAWFLRRFGFRTEQTQRKVL